MDNAEADFWVLGFIAHGMNLCMSETRADGSRRNRQAQTAADGCDN